MLHTQSRGTIKRTKMRVGGLVDESTWTSTADKDKTVSTLQAHLDFLGRLFGTTTELNPKWQKRPKFQFSRKYFFSYFLIPVTRWARFVDPI